MAPIMVFAMDADGTCTVSDGAGLAAFGLEPDQLVGRDMFEQFADDDRALDHLRRALAGESFRSTYDRPELGRVFTTSWHPTRTDGRVTGALGISLDMTDQSRAETEALRYRALVDAAPDFIGLANLDETLMYINPGGRAMIGLPDDLDVTSTSVADYLTAEGLTLALAEIAEVVEHGSFRGEAQMRQWSSGAAIPVAASSFLVRDPATGEPSALGTVRTDITAVVDARLAANQTLAHQRGLLLHLHEAQEAERRRIAGELHDDTIQVLAAVNLRLGGLRNQLAQVEDGGRMVEGIDRLDDAVRAATSRLRAIMSELDPAPVEEVGLESLLRQQAQTILRESGTSWSVDVDVDATPTDLVGRILIRIAQEALTNVRKHSGATSVAVGVVQAEGHYLLTVRDDGVGITAQAGAAVSGLPVVERPGAAAGEAHIGLRSMGERAESIGGWCRVGPAEAGGSLVEARLPSRVGHPDGSTDAPHQRVFLEQTMEILSDAYCALDEQWRYVYMNSAGYRLLERDPAESVIGKVIWDEFHVAPEFEAAYRRARAEQVQVQVSGYYAPWDKWIENRIFPTASGLSIFARDVTEEMKLAQDSRERGRLIESGRAIVEALIDEADLERALHTALTRLVADWRLDGVAIRVPASAKSPGLDLTVGDSGADTAERMIFPLVSGGREVATMELFGEDGTQLENTMLGLFAMRVAAGSGPRIEHG